MPAATRAVTTAAAIAIVDGLSVETAPAADSVNNRFVLAASLAQMLEGAVVKLGSLFIS